MRADRPQDRTFARWIGAVLVPASLLTGGLLAGLPGMGAGALLGTVAAIAFHRHLGHRSARRRALLVTPFPEQWRAYLLEEYDHFERMPEPLRRRFEDDVRIFMLETRITGVGVLVTDELRLLVAASAVTLSVAWPDYEWDQLTEVLLYPQEFDRDYDFEGTERAGLDPEGHLQESELAGQAHPWGTVILSVPSLFESFEDPDDGFHVGIHEFAHLLDVDRTHFDGIPVGLDGERARAWVEVAERERGRLVREEREGLAPGKRKRRPAALSAFDPYGASDPVEFLAVAVEAFFESSLEVRRRHGDLYALLAAYFGQDPAAWDDARGLVLD